VVTAIPLAPAYREVRPGGSLGSFVSAAWVRSSRSDADTEYLEIPDGQPNLVCRIGAAPQLIGPLTSPRRGQLRPAEVLVGLRLHPGAAALLGVPVAELTDRTVEARELLGAATAGQLSETTAPIGALGLLAQTILIKAHDSVPDPIIGESIARLSTEDEISAVWRSMEMSERSFRRRFIAAVGIGPKTIQTLLRFQRLLGRAQRAVAAGRPVAEHGLAALAHDSGYADQPHLSRECLRITGSTLGSYLGDLEGHCADHDHRAQLST
jgi:AraC-like DNA-binding protein